MTNFEVWWLCIGLFLNLSVIFFGQMSTISTKPLFIPSPTNKLTQSPLTSSTLTSLLEMPSAQAPSSIRPHLRQMTLGGPSEVTDNQFWMLISMILLIKVELWLPFTWTFLKHLTQLTRQFSCKKLYQYEIIGTPYL